MSRRRGRRRGRRRKPFKLKLRKDTVYSVSSTTLFVIGGLILLSFSQKGTLLIALYSFLSRLFGWGIILLPFLFIAAGLMLTRLSWRVTRPNIFVGGFLIFLSSIGLTKAGAAGFAIWSFISRSITSFGAIIILMGSVFIGFVVLFETSLEEILLFIAKFLEFFKKAFRISFRRKEKYFKF